jgi:pimeloyl-ACP methyl ester carboxylesterase
VCSYDRAGSGWSDWGPHPRTFRQVVYELHTLLTRSGEIGPFIMVGASYGGWIVRLYQLTYPGEVAGMVLVDAGATDPARLMPDGRVVRSSELAHGRAIPEIKTAGPLRESEIPPAALAQIRAGLSSASARANEPPRDKLPTQAQQMRTWALGQVGHVVAAVNPFEAEELAELRRAMTDRVNALADLPLVILTRGRPDEDGSDVEVREAAHRADQARQAAMSRMSRHLFAEKSGHHIELEDPDLVVRSIRELLAKTRR